MKVIVALLLLASVSVWAQPKTKKVLVEGEGLPIVLLNGGTADMSVFSPHSQQLSTDFKVIRMEHFNVQYANENRTLPKSYSVSMESNAIKATLDSLQIKEPVVVVGHSFGGLIALDFALNHPRYVHSLVLLEPPVFAIVNKSVRLDELKKMQKLLKKLPPRARITEDLVKDFRCALMDCDTVDIRQHPLWNTWIQQKNRLRGLSAINQYKVRPEQLRRFQKPVFIMTGTQTVPFHQKIDALLAAGFPKAQTASLKGGHIAVNTSAAEFVKQLKDFLSVEK